MFKQLFSQAPKHVEQQSHGRKRKVWGAVAAITPSVLLGVPLYLYKQQMTEDDYKFMMKKVNEENEKQQATEKKIDTMKSFNSEVMRELILMDKRMSLLEESQTSSKVPKSEEKSKISEGRNEIPNHVTELRSNMERLKKALEESEEHAAITTTTTENPTGMSGIRRRAKQREQERVVADAAEMRRQPSE